MQERLPHFDSRVFGVPDMAAANRVLIWREQDAKRNAVQSLGQYIIGKKAIHGMTTKQVAKRLEDGYGEKTTMYGNHFARGTYFARVTEDVELTEEQRNAIPEKHRPPEGELVKRSRVVSINYDPRLYEGEYNGG